MKQLKIQTFKVEEHLNEPMNVLISPDGNIDWMTLAPNVRDCIGIIGLLHSKGLSASLEQLTERSYNIVHVYISLTYKPQNT